MPVERDRYPSNGELAGLFQEIADYLSLEGESTYRILAYQKAAALFASHPLSIAETAARGTLRELPGVGPAIEGKVLEYIATVEIALLEKLRERHPEGLREVMRLPGM